MSSPTSSLRDVPDVRHHAGKPIFGRRMAAILKPATRQIFARPLDPLSVATSYQIMRNGIAVLGLALPFVLILGGGLDHVQSSLSAYYHFSPAVPARYGAGTMRDAFVGMLFAIGAFLFFYRGHSIEEDLALNVAGISVVLVAVIPMDWPATTTRPTTTAGTIHSLAATLFFVMIAYVCVFRARDTLCLTCDQRRRRIFERIYLVLGILMLTTPTAIWLAEFISPATPKGYATLFIEIAGVFVFAIFWLVKGFEIRSSLRPAAAPPPSGCGTEDMVRPEAVAQPVVEPHRARAGIRAGQ